MRRKEGLRKNLGREGRQVRQLRKNKVKEREMYVRVYQGKEECQRVNQCVLCVYV